MALSHGLVSKTSAGNTPSLWDRLPTVNVRFLRSETMHCLRNMSYTRPFIQVSSMYSGVLIRHIKQPGCKGSTFRKSSVELTTDSRYTSGKMLRTVQDSAWDNVSSIFRCYRTFVKGLARLYQVRWMPTIKEGATRNPGALG
jgi:hypothetical protein